LYQINQADRFEKVLGKLKFEVKKRSELNQCVIGMIPLTYILKAVLAFIMIPEI
jgi:hypothetical protein